MFTLRWTLTASESYNREIDFIFEKWERVNEVEKFITIVEDFLNTLSSGILQGKPSKKKGIRISVISEQTSLAYQIDEENKVIYLVTFWNNENDPEGYKEYYEA